MPRVAPPDDIGRMNARCGSRDRRVVVPLSTTGSLRGSRRLRETKQSGADGLMRRFRRQSPSVRCVRWRTASTTLTSRLTDLAIDAASTPASDIVRIRFSMYGETTSTRDGVRGPSSRAAGRFGNSGRIVGCATFLGLGRSSGLSVDTASATVAAAARFRDFAPGRRSAERFSRSPSTSTNPTCTRTKVVRPSNGTSG